MAVGGLIGIGRTWALVTGGGFCGCGAYAVAAKACSGMSRGQVIGRHGSLGSAAGSSYAVSRVGTCGGHPWGKQAVGGVLGSICAIARFRGCFEQDTIDFTFVVFRVGGLLKKGQNRAIAQIG